MPTPRPDDPTVLGPTSPGTPGGTDPTVPAGGGPTPGAVPRAGDGRPFGRYRLLEELGHGGMGIVWKAWDPDLKRVVALKQILGHAGDEQVARFTREAQASARLRHPRIVAVHDVGVVDGQPYFTSEYVVGRSLDQLLPGGLPIRRSLELVKQVAEALAYAHAQGIVHRDVKPSNVLIDEGGGPFIMDFGLAKEVTKVGEGDLTLSGQLLGTPAYMSPEQAAGRTKEAGPASDQFSLGIVLYEMLTGARPFDGTDMMSLLDAIVRQDPVPPSRRNAQVTRDAETICLKTIEKDPARRYPSLSDLAADIGRHLEGEPIQARPLSPLVRFARRAFKHRAVILPTVAAIVLVAALLSWQVVSARKTRVATDSERQALALLEDARSPLEKAYRYLREKDATYDELQKKVDVAQVRIEQAITRAPDLPLGHYLLGRAWELKGWEEKAEACWKEALRLDPAFGAARVQLARLYLARALVAAAGVGLFPEDASSPEVKRWIEAAKAQLVQPIRFESQGPEETVLAAEARAVQAYGEGDTEAVLRICDAALRANPDADGREDLYWLMGCVSEGDAKVKAFTEALTARPKFPLALYCRGVALSERGEVDVAIADCDEALAIQPRFVKARCSRAMMFVTKGDIETARADLDKAVATDAGCAIALGMRALVRTTMQGDLAGGQADATAALKIDPECAPAVFVRIMQGTSGLGSPAMLSELGRFLDIHPRFMMGFVARGTLNMYSGHLPEAAKDLRRALGLVPAHSVMYTRIKGMLDMVQTQLGGQGAIAWQDVAAMASLAFAQGDYAGAAKLDENVLRIALEAPDSGSPPALAEVHGRLARTYAQASIGKDGPRVQPRTVAADEAARLRDLAFRHLGSARGTSREEMERLMGEVDLTPLHDDPRWEELRRRLHR